MWEATLRAQLLATVHHSNTRECACLDVSLQPGGVCGARYPPPSLYLPLALPAGWQELFALLYSSLPLRQLRHLRQKYLLDAGLQITEMFSPQPKPFWKPDKPSPASPPSPLVESYHSCQGTVLFDLADQVGRAWAGQGLPNGVDMRSKVQALRVCAHRSPGCDCFL